MVNYKGNASKAKLQITGPDAVTYTYTLKGGEEVFALTAGSGAYTVNVFELISNINYSTALSAKFSVQLENDFLPFLYPNQYVMFTPDCETVKAGQQAAATAHDELEVVTNVYNYVMKNLSYDYDKAKNVQSGYTPVVDSILAAKKGICFDYAAVMATMLRSQGIPAKMDVGYAGTVYHAWISVYIDEIGWVNGIIEFNGVDWKMMDPTFADNEKQSRAIMDFINDTSNYSVKYKY